MVKNILFKLNLVFFGIILFLSLLLPVNKAKAYETPSPEMMSLLVYGGKQENLKIIKTNSESNQLHCHIRTSKNEKISGPGQVILFEDSQNKDQVVALLRVNNFDIPLENVEFPEFTSASVDFTPKVNGLTKSISCSTMKLW